MGYLFLKPEKGKIYESRNVRFIEKLVYGDIYGKNNILNFPKMEETLNKDDWFVVFHKGETHIGETFKVERENKRKRVRP